MAKLTKKAFLVTIAPMTRIVIDTNVKTKKELVKGMNISKFFYEHITGNSYEDYINSLKKRGLAFEAPQPKNDC